MRTNLCEMVADCCEPAEMVASIPVNGTIIRRGLCRLCASSITLARLSEPDAYPGWNVTGKRGRKPAKASQYDQCKVWSKVARSMGESDNANVN